MANGQPGPGDDIINELTKGTDDSTLLKKYKLSDEQLRSFKSLHYGMTSAGLKRDEVADYYPELKDFFAEPLPAQTVMQNVPRETLTEQKGKADSKPATEVPEPAQTVDPIKLAKERKKLQSLIDQQAKPVAAPGAVYKTSEYSKKYKEDLKAVNEKLASEGIDPAFADDISDIPEGEGLSFVVSVPQLLKLRSENKYFYNRSLATIKSKGNLFNAIRNRDGLEKAYEEIDYLQQLEEKDVREATRNAISLTRRYIDDTDKQNEIIKNILVDKSYDYGLQPVTEDERFAAMNPYQQRAMQFLEDVDPVTFEALQTILSSNPDDQWLGSTETSIRTGYETKARELELIGQNIERKALEEKLTNLIKQEQLTPDQQQEYDQLFERYQTLKADRDNQNQRYPYAAVLDADRIMQEALGNRNSVAKKFLLGIGENFDDAVNWIGGMLQDRGITGDLELLGDKEITQTMQQYTQEKDKLIGSDVIARFDDDLQKQVDEIKNSDLSDEKKQDAITGLILQNPESVAYVPNDKARKVNFTGKSVMTMVGDVAKDLTSQLAIAAMTGGGGNVSRIKQLSSLFGSTFATQYDDNYVAALRENNPNPSQYALVHTTIEAASELISNDFDIARKMVAGNSTLGKVLNKITKAEWDAIKGKGTFTAIKKSLAQTGKTAFENALQETKEEVAGQVAGNLADQQLFNKEIGIGEGIGDTIISTMVGMLPLGLLSLPFNYQKISRTQKYALYEAGMDPEKYLRAVEADLQSGTITEPEAQARKEAVNAAAAVAADIQAVRPDGSIMTDNEKADYLVNEVVKQQAEEMKDKVPEEMKEQLNEITEKLDKENTTIIQSPQKKKKDEKTKKTKTEVLTSKPEAAGEVISREEPAVSQAETGKEIEPHKEVRANKNVVIKEVAPKFKLNDMEASILWGLKDKDVQQEMDDATGLKEQMLKKLDDKHFFDYDDDGRRKLSDRAKDFITQAEARYQTRKQVKSGSDLFPEQAGIPELKAKEPVAATPVLKKQLEQAKQVTEDIAVDTDTRQQFDKLEALETRIDNTAYTKAKSKLRKQRDELIASLPKPQRMVYENFDDITKKLKERNLLTVECD